jgi:hypothetical protein
MIPWVLTALFGSGAFWQWLQSKRDDRKQEIENATKIYELRKEENDLYASMLELTAHYVKDTEEYGKAHSLEPKNELCNRLHREKAQLDMQKDNFIALESDLSHLERRAPRNIQLDFIPPPRPGSLKATVVLRPPVEALRPPVEVLRPPSPPEITPERNK